MRVCMCALSVSGFSGNSVTIFPAASTSISRGLGPSSDEGASLFQPLHGADLTGLRRFGEVEDHFLVAGEFLHFIRPGNQHVAVCQHKSIASSRLAGIPNLLPILIDDAGERRTGDEKGVAN